MLKRFKNCRNGAAAAIFALSAFPMFLCAGVTIDYMRLSGARSNLQTRLDAAVLAGALEASQADRISRAESVFDFPAALDGVNITSRQFQAVGDDLVGTVDATGALAFANIIGISSAALKAQATGRSGRSKVCVLITDPSSSQTLAVNSDFKISAPNCEIHVRTTNSPSASVNTASANWNVKRLCVQGNNYSGTAVAGLEKNCTTVSDPYAGRMPAVTVPTGCDYSNLSSNSGTYTVPASGLRYCGGSNFNGTAVNLKPGTYENMNFNGANIKVHLDPGLYVIKGDWQIGQGEFTGDNVTFYLSTTNSKLSIRSGVKISLTPPSSGTYKGILLFEPAGLAGSDLPWDGGASHSVSGLMYLPSRKLKFNSPTTLTATDANWVVNQLLMNAGTWTFSSAPDGMSIAGGMSSLVN